MARKQKWKNGDVFLVPLLDGTYAVGQVIGKTKEALNSAVCAFFDIRLTEGAAENIEELTDDLLVALKFSSVGLLDAGEWEVVDNRTPLDTRKYIDLDQLAKNGYINVRIVGSAILSELMNAYYALSPWDAFYDPQYLDKLLISPGKKLKNIILQ